MKAANDISKINRLHGDRWARRRRTARNEVGSCRQGNVDESVPEGREGGIPLCGELGEEHSRQKEPPVQRPQGSMCRGGGLI